MFLLPHLCGTAGGLGSRGREKADQSPHHSPLMFLLTPQLLTLQGCSEPDGYSPSPRNGCQATSIIDVYSWWSLSPGHFLLQDCLRNWGEGTKLAEVFIAVLRCSSYCCGCCLLGVLMSAVIKSVSNYPLCHMRGTSLIKYTQIPHCISWPHLQTDPCAMCQIHWELIITMHLGINYNNAPDYYEVCKTPNMHCLEPFNLAFTQMQAF